MRGGLITAAVISALVFFLVVIGFSAWWLWQYPASITYSNGERTGTLYKFSEKGLIIKNWCGEIQVGSFTQTDKGIITNYSQNQYTLEFGIDRKVNDPKLIAKINSLIGQPVKFTYEQKAFGGHPFLGCTDYLIKDIRGLK